mgnify:CR=1 FL=1
MEDGGFNWTIRTVVENAEGELTVVDNWSSFAVNIIGIDMLYGNHTIKVGATVLVGEAKCS